MDDIVSWVGLPREVIEEIIKNITGPVIRSEIDKGGVSVANFDDERVGALNSEQAMVWEAMAKGPNLDKVQIGRELGMSPKHVKHLSGVIYRRFGLKNCDYPNICAVAVGHTFKELIKPVGQG